MNSPFSIPFILSMNRNRVINLNTSIAKLTLMMNVKRLSLAANKVTEDLLVLNYISRAWEHRVSI